MEYNTNENIYSMSLVWKLLGIFFVIFFGWGIYISIFENDFTLLVICLPSIILVIVLLRFLLIKYFISELGIGSKLLFKERRYIKTEELMGFYIQTGEAVPEYVFLDGSGNKIKIYASGRRTKKALEEYLYNIEKELTIRTYNKIIKKGCDITGFSNKLIFRISNDEIYIAKTNSYIKWDDVKDININQYGAMLFYQIQSDRKIGFSIINAHGCIGMTKFLLEKKQLIKRSLTQV